jgi:hypothetical protein
VAGSPRHRHRRCRLPPLPLLILAAGTPRLKLPPAFAAAKLAPAVRRISLAWEGE